VTEVNVPTYQYACTACGHQLEAVQSFADEPLTQCPACEGRLRKLFGSVGIVFKGSGFYRTDSRAAGNGNGASGKDRGDKDRSDKDRSDKDRGDKDRSDQSTAGKSNGDGKASKETGTTAAKDSSTKSSKPSTDKASAGTA
jgi:putative FmdB family regulatory protein